MTILGLRRAPVGEAATLAMALAAAAPAPAPPNPLVARGDNGRSGYQPVEQGGVRVRFLHKEDGVDQRFIKTSIVTTSGPPTTAADGARLAFGTNDGRVLIRRLVDGTPVGAAAGTDSSP